MATVDDKKVIFSMMGVTKIIPQSKFSRTYIYRSSTELKLVL